MNFGLVSNTYSTITNGNAALQTAKTNAENSQFAQMLELMQRQNDGKGTLASEEVTESGRMNGDYTTGFAGTYTNEADKTARPMGAAANQGNPNVKPKEIDKTSALYEKSMELESFFVKQMLSSMRSTIMKSSEDDFAKKMYEDMLFDEYATSMTKNAGFGLADQIYLSLI